MQSLKENEKEQRSISKHNIIQWLIFLEFLLRFTGAKDEDSVDARW